LSEVQVTRLFHSIALSIVASLAVLLSGCSSYTMTGASGGSSSAPTVSIAANPTSVNAGSSTALTVTATNATQVVVTGSDGSSYNLPMTGGTQNVSPTATATYTATASGSGGTATATATVTVIAASLQSINHVIFMLQENHTFDNYFGMLNPYRQANGWNVGDDGVDYAVDGIDDEVRAGAVGQKLRDDRVREASSAVDIDVLAAWNWER